MASQFDKAQALPSQDGGAQPQFQSQLPPEGAASQQQVAQFGGVPQVYPQPGSGPAPPYVSASIGYAPPPGYAPPSAQMQGYMMTAGPGGYAPLPGQPQYPGYPATYGPGPGQGQMPPGTYFQMQGGSAQVVTTQVMPMAQPVQPVNNSLITTSLGTSSTIWPNYLKIQFHSLIYRSYERSLKGESL